MGIDEGLYHQEVQELTDLVRHEWDDLRNILIESTFDLDKTLLVVFMEDENENEFGVLVTESKRVFEYERSTATDRNNIHHFYLKEITDDPIACNRFPQIGVAKKMIDDGYLQYVIKAKERQI